VRQGRRPANLSLSQPAQLSPSRTDMGVRIRVWSGPDLLSRSWAACPAHPRNDRKSALWHGGVGCGTGEAPPIAPTVMSPPRKQ
jgi:hypothetical protein